MTIERREIMDMLEQDNLIRNKHYSTVARKEEKKRMSVIDWGYIAATVKYFPVDTDWRTCIIMGGKPQRLTCFY